MYTRYCDLTKTPSVLHNVVGHICVPQLLVVVTERDDLEQRALTLVAEGGSPKGSTV